MDHDQPQNSKQPILRIILLIIALLLLLMVVIFVKKCGVKPTESGGNSGDHSQRKLGPSVPIAKLLNPIPDGAGPFATKIGDTGSVYFIHTDQASGKQTLRDDTGAVIYSFSDPKKKAWVAGFTESRVLIFNTEPSVTLAHPKEAWDTRQHFSISPTSIQFGIGPIFHNEETLKAIIDSL